MEQQDLRTRTALSGDAETAAAQSAVRSENISRRSALSQIGRAVAWTEVAAMTLPSLSFLGAKGSRVNGIRERQLAETGQITEYPKTDSFCGLPLSAGTFHNLGVAHVDWFYRRWREHLEQRIDSADIILVEHANLGIMKDKEFFGPIVEYARAKGKTVIDIDRQPLSGIATWKFGPIAATLAGFGLTGRRILKDQEWSQRAVGKEMEFTRVDWLIRRAPLRLLGWAGILASTESPETVLDPKGYPRANFSYWIDGRTVKMLENVQKVVDSNPDRKILAISGDTHARGFAHYANNPRAFAWRSEVYQWTWDLVYGRPMQQAP